MLGWIKLHRGFLEWEWFDDEKMVKTFIYLLIRANFEDSEWMGIKVSRGQLISGLNKLSASLGFSIQTTRTALDKLKSTKEITISSTNKYSIITICNYDCYQTSESEINKQINSPITNDQQSDNKPITTDKEYKKKDNVKKERKVFIPPLIEEVKKYFLDNGYSEQSAEKFFNYYHVAEWKDSKGNQVKNWKQKSQGIWFKPENKIQPTATQFNFAR
jgi:hypothetical protein